MNLLHGNVFSVGFINPSSSVLTIMNEGHNYICVHIRTLVLVLVEAHVQWNNELDSPGKYNCFVNPFTPDVIITVR